MDRAKLCMFAAAMHTRTTAQGEHWRKQMARVHEKVEAMERALGVEPKESLATAKIVKNAHTDIVFMSLKHETPLLFQMNMTILVTEDETGFITSDAPCVWHNPKLHTFPPFYRSPGLAQKDIEVYLPLTPQHSLVISHHDVGMYISANSKAVQEINRTMRFTCDEEFVSWKGVVDSFWFSEREMPEDAWEKTEHGEAAMADAEEQSTALELPGDGKPEGA